MIIRIVSFLLKYGLDCYNYDWIDKSGGAITPIPIACPCVADYGCGIHTKELRYKMTLLISLWLLSKPCELASNNFEKCMHSLGRSKEFRGGKHFQICKKIIITSPLGSRMRGTICMFFRFRLVGYSDIIS